MRWWRNTRGWKTAKRKCGKCRPEVVHVVVGVLAPVKLQPRRYNVRVSNTKTGIRRPFRFCLDKTVSVKVVLFYWIHNCVHLTQLKVASWTSVCFASSRQRSLLSLEQKKSIWRSSMWGNSVHNIHIPTVGVNSDTLQIRRKREKIFCASECGLAMCKFVSLVLVLLAYAHSASLVSLKWSTSGYK